MPNFTQSFKAEVIRLSRKEIKAAIGPVRKPSIAAKKAVAELNKRLSLLEKSVAALQKQLSRCEAAAPVVAKSEEGKKARITGKGMRSLRKKLRLTGAEFAKLLGVSLPNVYQWEQKNGPIRVRQTTKAAILGVRDFGSREAKAKLAEMVVVKKAVKSKKTKKA